MPDTPAITVNELVALYCRFELPDLVPAARKQRARKLRDFALQFGARPWNEVRRSEIKEWIRSVDRWKTDHSRKTVVIAVNRLFRWAWEDDRIPHLPVRKLTWAEGAPRRSMTDAEYRLLLRAFAPYVRRVLLFIRETGCRPQDVANLEWSMIRWEDGIVILPAHKTVKKTGKPRILYLSAVTLRLLAWMRRQRDRLPDFGPAVFLNRYARAWTSNALTMAIYRARNACRLDPRCVLYGLRHSLTNRLQAAGVDIRTTADILGHGTVRTTERHYLHSQERTHATRAALERVSGQANQKATGIGPADRTIPPTE